jgi:hypothetical protein
MSKYQYITGTNHAETLSAALDAFCRALTRRWREEVCNAIVVGDPSFPRWIRREASPASTNSMVSAIRTIFPNVGRGGELRWDCWSAEARSHLELGSACAYIWWVDHGQEGELSAASCLGYTDGRQDAHGGSVPDQIECGMGLILEQVADWAYAEREHVFSQLPLFDRHDVSALEAAHDALIRLGAELGLEAADGSDESLGGSFDDMHEREITTVAASIFSREGVDNDWLAGWTGLAARQFKSGFAASVIPTVNNQSKIVGVLANLYAARAAIIEKGRRDALYWIASATVSLDQTEVVTTDRDNFWVAVEGIGMATAVVFAPSVVGSAVGAGIALVGFMGQYLDPGSTTEVYANDMVEVVDRLDDEINNLNVALGGLEIGYSSDVDRLRETIHGIHSYNLELYDLTENPAEGDHDEPIGDPDEDNDGDPGWDDTSFTADIAAVLEFGDSCYTAGELYASLLPIIADTRRADQHLADKDGRPTLADRRLVEVRDRLEEYLKTSCGRCLVAGDELRAAAEAYVHVDTTQRDQFNRIMAGWEAPDLGELASDFDPQEYAEATDRPWTWAPDQEFPGQGSSEPAAGVDTDYGTRSDVDEERDDE